METAHDIHSACQGIEHDASLTCRQHSTLGRYPEDEVVRDTYGARQGVSEIAANRDGVGLPIKHLAGVESSLLAIDHRENFVLL